MVTFASLRNAARISGLLTAAEKKSLNAMLHIVRVQSQQPGDT